MQTEELLPCLKAKSLSSEVNAFKMVKNPANPVYVLGVGMTKFIKPRGKVDYTELGCYG
jgi:hypothetical protein